MIFDDNKDCLPRISGHPEEEQSWKLGHDWILVMRVFESQMSSYQKFYVIDCHFKWPLLVNNIGFCSRYTSSSDHYLLAASVENWEDVLEEIFVGDDSVMSSPHLRWNERGALDNARLLSVVSSCNIAPSTPLDPSEYRFSSPVDDVRFDNVILYSLFWCIITSFH